MFFNFIVAVLIDVVILGGLISRAASNFQRVYVGGRIARMPRTNALVQRDRIEISNAIIAHREREEKTVALRSIGASCNLIIDRDGSLCFDTKNRRCNDR